MFKLFFRKINLFLIAFLILVLGVSGSFGSLQTKAQNSCPRVKYYFGMSDYYDRDPEHGLTAPSGGLHLPGLMTPGDVPGTGVTDKYYPDWVSNNRAELYEEEIAGFLKVHEGSPWTLIRTDFPKGFEDKCFKLPPGVKFPPPEKDCNLQNISGCDKPNYCPPPGTPGPDGKCATNPPKEKPVAVEDDSTSKDEINNPLPVDPKTGKRPNAIYLMNNDGSYDPSKIKDIPLDLLKNDKPKDGGLKINSISDVVFPKINTTNSPAELSNQPSVKIDSSSSKAILNPPALIDLSLSNVIKSIGFNTITFKYDITNGSEVSNKASTKVKIQCYARIPEGNLGSVTNPIQLEDILKAYLENKIDSLDYKMNYYYEIPNTEKIDINYTDSNGKAQVQTYNIPKNGLNGKPFRGEAVFESGVKQAYSISTIYFTEEICPSFGDDAEWKPSQTAKYKKQAVKRIVNNLKSPVGTVKLIDSTGYFCTGQSDGILVYSAMHCFAGFPNANLNPLGKTVVCTTEVIINLKKTNMKVSENIVSIKIEDLKKLGIDLYFLPDSRSFNEGDFSLNYSLPTSNDIDNLWFIKSGGDIIPSEYKKVKLKDYKIIPGNSGGPINLGPNPQNLIGVVHGVVTDKNEKEGYDYRKNIIMTYGGMKDGIFTILKTDNITNQVTLTNEISPLCKVGN